MHQRFVGKTFERMVREVERNAAALPVDLEARKDGMMLDIYRRELKPVPGVGAMLERLHLPRASAPMARAPGRWKPSRSSASTVSSASG